MRENRKWIISERRNGLGLSVMNHGATYDQVEDRNYFLAVDMKEYQKLEAENKVLREALEFYANPENMDITCINSKDIEAVPAIIGKIISHVSEPPFLVQKFCAGLRAREALAQAAKIRGG